MVLNNMNKEKIKELGQKLSIFSLAQDSLIQNGPHYKVWNTKTANQNLNKLEK